MRVEEAATTSPYVDLMFIFFFLLYATLATVGIIVLRKLFRNNPVEVELEKKYPSIEKGDS